MSFLTSLANPRYRKYAVAAIGVAAAAATQLAPVLPEEWKPWAAVIVAVAVAVGVRQAANTEPPKTMTRP
jgi:precorrin isomerase